MRESTQPTCQEEATRPERDFTNTRVFLPAHNPLVALHPQFSPISLRSFRLPRFYSCILQPQTKPSVVLTGIPENNSGWDGSDSATIWKITATTEPIETAVTLTAIIDQGHLSQSSISPCSYSHTQRRQAKSPVLKDFECLTTTPAETEYIDSEDYSSSLCSRLLSPFQHHHPPTPDSASRHRKASLTSDNHSDWDGLQRLGRLQLVSLCSRDLFSFLQLLPQYQTEPPALAKLSSTSDANFGCDEIHNGSEDYSSSLSVLDIPRFSDHTHKHQTKLSVLTKASLRSDHSSSWARHSNASEDCSVRSFDYGSKLTSTLEQDHLPPFFPSLPISTATVAKLRQKLQS